MMVEALKNNKNGVFLSHLDIGNNEIDGEGMGLLADFIAGLKSKLEFVDVSNNIKDNQPGMAKFINSLR